jgi:hypothetical protein
VLDYACGSGKARHPLTRHPFPSLPLRVDNRSDGAKEQLKKKKEHISYLISFAFFLLGVKSDRF